MADSFLLTRSVMRTGSLPRVPAAHALGRPRADNLQPTGPLNPTAHSRGGLFRSIDSTAQASGIAPGETKPAPSWSRLPLQDSLDSALFRAEVVLFPSLAGRGYPWPLVKSIKAASELFSRVSPPFLFNYKLKKCCVTKILRRRMPAHIPGISGYFEGG